MHFFVEIAIFHDKIRVSCDSCPDVFSSGKVGDTCLANPQKVSKKSLTGNVVEFKIVYK